MSPAKDAPGKARGPRGLCINPNDKARGEEGGMMQSTEQGELCSHTQSVIQSAGSQPSQKSSKRLKGQKC